MANIGFISLGCAKNQVDCERMMYRVQEAGHTVCAGIVGCDVVVINTCGFIDSAKSEAIDFILQTAALKAEGQVGKILVTGCLSQRYQQQILDQLPEVDGILGTGSYHKVVEAIDALLTEEAVSDFASIDEPELETGRILTTPEHYAYLKIAELLTPEEEAICRRARNSSHLNIPKSASSAEYKNATSFEALFGYLHLKGEGERISALFNHAYADLL
jgi:tRNA A37 methylthiotransferase MiaB